jgi:hypothetical protein
MAEMRELHAYIVALNGCIQMRMILAALLATCALAVTPAHAGTGDCPPNCDRIPDSAWIEPSAIPLYPVYRWPVTTDEPDRIAAVISVGGERVLHTYLLVQPRSSTVVELSLWASTPPLVYWPPVADQQIFDAMAAPLCTAYIGSCR